MEKKNYIMSGNVKMVFGRVSPEKYGIYYPDLPKKVREWYNYAKEENDDGMYRIVRFYTTTNIE